MSSVKDYTENRFVAARPRFPSKAEGMWNGLAKFEGAEHRVWVAVLRTQPDDAATRRFDLRLVPPRAGDDIDAPEVVRGVLTHTPRGGVFHLYSGEIGAVRPERYPVTLEVRTPPRAVAWDEECKAIDRTMLIITVGRDHVPL